MDFFESDMCNPNLTPEMLQKIAGDKSKRVYVNDKFVELLYGMSIPSDVSQNRMAYYRRLKEENHNNILKRDSDLSSKID
jgi:hypothetical protein